MTMETLVGDIVAHLEKHGVLSDSHGQGTGRSVADYAELVREGTWLEASAKGTGQVTGKIWTLAIQAALDENRAVFIPNRGEPYYIDAPIVLKSGYRLIADPSAEIRLKPGTNTCMVRNANPAYGQEGPVNGDDNPDVDITIEGGIWTTLCMNPEANGNFLGGPDPANALHGHGTILLNHVKGARVRNIVIKECLPHGVQLSNVSDFLVENVRFVNHHRDGVHVNGPASYGIIRNIRGITGDDMIALNAWDWKNTCMTFGPIHHILVENVHAGEPGSDYKADIRFLGGTKHFPDGKTIDCDIENCVVRDISGVRSFKMYDQPNLELGRENDFADPIGNFQNLFLADLLIDHPSEPSVQIASNVDGLSIERVTVAVNQPADKCKLVLVGPMSATFKMDPANPASWVEIFSPDKDCTVRNLRLAKIFTQGTSKEKTVTSPVDPAQCIEIVQLKPNPDYPKTTPKGGTGRGILIP